MIEAEMYTTGTCRFSCSVVRRYGVLALPSSSCFSYWAVVACCYGCCCGCHCVRSGAGHRRRGLGVYAPSRLIFHFGTTRRVSRVKTGTQIRKSRSIRCAVSMYSSASEFSVPLNTGTTIFGLRSDPQTSCAFAVGSIVVRCAYLPNCSGGGNWIARWYARARHY